MSPCAALRAPAARWIAAALWAAVIFGLSSVPGSRLPGNVGGYGHFVAYAILGALILLALRGRHHLLRAVVLASAYGVTDELHQLFVPGRTADPIDWLVDTAGALAGAALALWLVRRRTAGGAGRSEGPA